MGKVVQIRPRPPLRETLQPIYREAHAATCRLILALRRVGKHDEADAVMRALGDAGSAVTRACREDG